MTAQTIEDALQNMGERLSHPSMAQRARDAIEAGDELNINIKVKRDKQGVVVAMHSTLASQREDHGRLIRLE